MKVKLVQVQGIIFGEIRIGFDSIRRITRLNTPAGTWTETSILYTDRQMDGHTDGRTDRLIPVYIQKHLFPAFSP